MTTPDPVLQDVLAFLEGIRTPNGIGVYLYDAGPLATRLRAHMADSSAGSVVEKKPRLLWNDDGNSFLCEGCGEVIPRARSNPYPEHKCPTAGESAATDPVREAVKALLNWIDGPTQYVRMLPPARFVEGLRTALALPPATCAECERLREDKNWLRAQDDKHIAERDAALAKLDALQAAVDEMPTKDALEVYRHIRNRIQPLQTKKETT